MVRWCAGQWGVGDFPHKLWWVQDGADVAAVNQAFVTFNIPTMQQELNNIIQFALKMAEDVTDLPAMMQGRTPGAPTRWAGCRCCRTTPGRCCATLHACSMTG